MPASRQPPSIPGIGGDADHSRQIHALQAGKFAGQPQRQFRIESVARHQAAILRALFPQQPGQPAGVDAGQGDHAALAQVIVQRLLVAPVAGAARTIAHYQAAGVNAGRFLVAPVDADVADVRIGQGDDLLAIGRDRSGFPDSR